MLYRYRGKRLKSLNRLEYCSCVRVVKDPEYQIKESNKTTHQGRINNKQFRFSEGIEISANHHQIMRSKSCTPKLFKSPPPHPGLQPETDDDESEEAKKWRKKADKFACYYLTMFQPEPELCDETLLAPEKCPRYDWHAFELFVKDLQNNEGKPQQVAIKQF